MQYRPSHFRPTSDDLPPGKWPAQGAWTVADWGRLPNDENERYELIDGALFMTTAPSSGHQWTNTRLGQVIANYLVAQPEPSGVVINTPGVILPTGPVVPDVVYIRMDNIGILTPERIVGVPDLVVEIASPGTAGYDRREKQDAYARSGVPEYWWVEPANRTVEVLTLVGDHDKTLAPASGQTRIQSHVLPRLTFAADSIFMPPALLAQLGRS